MLFVPPSMPFMDPIPEAAADHSSNLQGAITDLSLVSVVDYDPPFSSALRNKITLSWSAPNDNGSPITYYVVQAKGTSGNWVKLDHMESTVTTYTHTTVVNVQIQYRVWATGPDGCHGNTTTYYDTLPCNEGNILSVVSANGGGILPPKAGCDNEHLDDCGYWDDETAPVITVPADILISCQEGMTGSGCSTQTVTFDVTASDDVGVTSGPTCSPASGSTFSVTDVAPNGTTVTCTASDAAGNTGTASFTVTVFIPIKPRIEIPLLNNGESYQIGETIHISGTVTCDASHPWATSLCLNMDNIDLVRITMWAHGDRDIPFQYNSAGSGTFATDYDTTGWEPFDGGEVSVRLVGYDLGSDYHPDGKTFSIVAAPAADTTPPTSASGTFTVTDGTNGGDCTQIGTWNSGSKTCTVTADINGGIIVGSNGITLDGNSSEFSGWIDDSDCTPSCSHNISTNGKNNITIKNFGSLNSAGSFALVIFSSQYVTVTNNNDLAAAIISSQHVTMTDNTIKPAVQMIHAAGFAPNCPSDIEINNNTFEQMGSNTPGILLAGAAYQTNISCVWYNLNAAGNTGSGNTLNFNLNAQTPTPQLTINSLDIYEDENNFWRYHVTGDAPPSTNLTVQLAAPGGIYFTWNDQFTTSTAQSTYDKDGSINDPDFTSATGLTNSTAHTGTWLIKICDNNPTVCVEQNFTISAPGDVLITDAEARAAAADNYWTLEYTGDNIPLNIHVYTNDVLFFTGGERISDIHIVSTPWRSTGCTTIGIGGTCIIDFSDWSLGQHEYNTNGGSIGDGNPNTGEGKFTVFAADESADTTPPVLVPPSSVSYSTTNSTGQQIYYQSTTATDDVGVTSGPTCSPSSGSIFSVGITTVTCTATDAAGNVGTASFTVTINQTVQGSFTTITQYFPDGIDGPGSAPMTCIQYENLPAGVEYTALLGPHMYNSFEGANSVFYYDENFQWVSWLSHIDSSDPRFSSTTTSNQDFRKCSNGLASGDYKHVAFADGVGNPNDPNVPNMADLVEIATPVTYNPDTTDTTPPVLVPPSSVSYSTTNSTGPQIYYQSTTATDDVGVTSGPTCSPSSGSIFSVGVTTVTCTATDAAGNVGTASFTVTLILGDGIPPPTPITQNFAITGFGNSQGSSGWLHLAIDDSGIYVADRQLDIVKKFDFAGNLIFTITDNISNAADIALDSNHNIYLTDRGSNSIKKFDSDGSYLGVFATVSNVGGIGIDSSGKVYVGSHGTSAYSGQNHVYIFNSNGNQLNAIPVNQFASFYPLAVEPNGTFYISNTKTPTSQPWVVSKYSSSGTFQNYIGSTEQGGTDAIDRHSGPYCIGVYNSKVYVCEQNESVVKIFDTNGNLEKIISPLCRLDANISCSGSDYALHSFGSPSDVVLDSVGNIYIADPVKQRILVLPPNSGIAASSYDITSPVVTVSNTMTNSTSNPAGKVIPYTIIASDNVGVTSGPTCSPPSGSIFPIGTTTITCTAIDAAGNVGTGTFTVTITLEEVDPNMPTMAASAYLNDTSATGRTLHVTTDNLNSAEVYTKFVFKKNGMVVEPHENSYSLVGWMTFSEQFIAQGFWQHDVPNWWVAGTYDIVWNSYCDNDWTTCFTESSASFTIPAHPDEEVDTTSPVVTVPSNLTFTVDSEATEDRYLTASDVPAGAITATDNVGVMYDTAFCDSARMQHLPAYLVFTSEAGYWNMGTTTVTCYAEDAAGNVGTASFTVTLILGEVEEEVDTTPPNLVVSNDIDTQTYNTNGKLVYYPTPAATDAGGIVSEPSCNYPSGYMFPVGITIVTCTAVDTAGNEAVKSFTITVVHSVEADTTKPVFTPVDEVQLNTTNPEGIVYNYAIPQVDDNIGVTIGPTCTPAPGSTFLIGTNYVVCTASDAAGNQGMLTFTIIVVNPNATSDAPIFDPVDDIPPAGAEPIVADVPNGKQLYFDIPTATDDETESLSIFCDPSPGFLFPVGDYPVTCTAIDEDGNQGAVTFTVTIDPQTQQQPSDQTADTSITSVGVQQSVNGDSTTEVSAGGLAYFTTSLATNSTGNAFVTVYVEDYGSTSLGVVHFKSVIGVGDSDLTLAIRVPSDAISGTADIHVNVWETEDMNVPITTEVSGTVQITGLDPADLGAFNYSFEGLPDIYSSPPGFSAANVVDGAKSYWKGSPPVDTFLTWSQVYDDLQNVNSYAESKIPFGNDFVTDLKINEVPWYDSDGNLQIYWVKDYGGGTLGIAPISTYSDVLVDVIYMSLGDSNCESSPGVWQPYSEKYLTETLQHEMGHVIGFAHDENPNSLMYSESQGTEYGIVEHTIKTTGWYGHWVPICTPRDQTDFNYHVSVDPDDEIPLDVYFVPSVEEYDNALAGEPFNSYSDCSHESMISVTATCTNVTAGSGLVILMPEVPNPSEVSGFLTDVTVKLQENFDGMQSLSNVATTQEAPIIPTSTQTSRVELLEVSEVEVEHESVFIDGTNFLEIPDIILAQDTVKFSILGWMEPDFSKGSQDLTIVSKYESFNLFLVGESFKFQNGKMSIVPATLNFSVYDGTEWYTVQGNTEISEDWYQVAAVVDDSVATLYLNGKVEGKVKLEKDVPVGYSLETGKCQQKSCTVDVKMSTSDADITVGAYVTKKIGWICCDDDGFMKPLVTPTAVNHFSGVVSSVERFSDAFSERQILKLYERDKNYFEKDPSIDSISIGTESPALSDSECLDLAKERGLEALAQVAHTLVCQFPFNAVIPLNSSILWMETLSSSGGPYHMMRSVDNLFATTPALFALMDFNEPEFTYGAYEYVDDLNKSLTGKIIIAKQLDPIDSRISTLPQGSSTLENINVSRNSAGPDCGIDNSCYEPFAVSVDVRKMVTWKNLDSFSHTVTSGTPEDGPDGVFDSGILANYRYFSHTFYEPGIYDYYCTLHPWMQGMVAVGEI